MACLYLKCRITKHEGLQIRHSEVYGRGRGLCRRPEQTKNVIDHKKMGFLHSVSSCGLLCRGGGLAERGSDETAKKGRGQKEGERYRGETCPSLVIVAGISKQEIQGG